MNDKIKKRITDTIAKILINAEHFGLILLKWNIVESKDIPTMATDYDNLYYNPDFVSSLDDRELMGVILHEMIHCLFFHPTELDRAIAKGKEKRIWTIAQEIATNVETINLASLCRGFSAKLPGKPLSPFKDDNVSSTGIFLPDEKTDRQEFYWFTKKYADLSVPELYKKLLEEVEFITLTTSSSQCFQYSGKKSDKFPEKSILEGDVIPVSDRAKEREAIERTIAVLEKTLKDKGDLPAGLKRLLQNLKKPEVDWRRVLRNFLGKTVYGLEDYRWDHPNFRHPLAKEVIVPGMVKEDLENVVVVIDTSGSISERELTAFVSEISGIFKEFDLEYVRVITTDAKVHEDVKVKNLKEFLKGIKFKGGGGTDFRNVFEKVKKCFCMIFFTDGMATYPEKPPKYPVLWILTKQHQKPPWGKTGFILST